MVDGCLIDAKSSKVYVPYTIIVHPYLLHIYLYPPFVSFKSYKLT